WPVAVLQWQVVHLDAVDEFLPRVPRWIQGGVDRSNNLRHLCLCQRLHAALGSPDHVRIVQRVDVQNSHGECAEIRTVLTSCGFLVRCGKLSESKLLTRRIGE